MEEIDDWKQSMAADTLSRYAGVMDEVVTELTKESAKARIDVDEFKEYFYTDMMSGEQEKAAVAVRQYMRIFGPDIVVECVDSEGGHLFNIPAIASSTRWDNMDMVGSTLSDTEQQYTADMKNIPVIASQRRHATFATMANELTLARDYGEGWADIHSYFGTKPITRSEDSEDRVSAGDLLT